MTTAQGTTIANPWAGAHYLGTLEQYHERQDAKRRQTVLANRAARTLKTGN